MKRAEYERNYRHRKGAVPVEPVPMCLICKKNPPRSWRSKYCQECFGSGKDAHLRQARLRLLLKRRERHKNIVKVLEHVRNELSEIITQGRLNGDLYTTKQLNRIHHLGKILARTSFDVQTKRMIQRQQERDKAK